MSSRTRQSGDLKRTVKCSFCGGHHRRGSRDQRECRKRARRGQSEPTTPSLDGGKTTKPSGFVDARKALGGNKRAHGVAKRLREGMAPRKIAKQMGIPLAEVVETERRLRK